MSSKQLAWTVVDGRRVTFRFLTGEEIVGYLCGMDDFHWMVITPEAHKHLVHKGSVAILDLGEDSTYESELRHKELEQVVRPFRQFVAERFFGAEADHTLTLCDRCGEMKERVSA